MRYIEYYEASNDSFLYHKEDTEYKFYFMPVDSEAKHKENLDTRSRRIWRLDTWTGRAWYVLDLINNKKHMSHPETHWKTPVDQNEFKLLQLKADPVDYSDVYKITQEREKRKAQK